MEKATRGWTLKELAVLLGGELEGQGDIWVTGPASAQGGGANEIAFAENIDYLELADKSDVGAIITYKGAPVLSKPYLRVDFPKQTFGRFLSLCQNAMPLELGIHPSAVVAPSAKISETARIGAYVVIEEGAVVEHDAKIYPFVFIGSNAHIGSSATIYPHVVLYSDVSVGDGTIIHSHAVIGSDGFGFTWNGSEHVKVPHLGKTEIGANVEIGAGTTVDRAMLGVTSIGDGSKIDNQVQVGHNSVIGKHGIVASQTGISGSCTIGDRVTLAGQVGLADHVTVGNDVILTARSAIASNIMEKGAYRGAPALPIGEQLRMEASLRKLPLLLKRVKELEQKIEKLSSQNDS